MGKPTRIDPALDAIRNAFNLRIKEQLGVKEFQKQQSDKILARTITEANLLDFKIDITKRTKRGSVFDISFNE